MDHPLPHPPSELPSDQTAQSAVALPASEPPILASDTPSLPSEPPAAASTSPKPASPSVNHPLPASETPNDASGSLLPTAEPAQAASPAAPNDTVAAPKPAQAASPAARNDTGADRGSAPVDALPASPEGPDLPELNLDRSRVSLAVSRALAASPYDPDLHLGRLNPYTGEPIASRAGYEEYIREYTFRRLCQADIALLSASRASEELARAEARHRELQSKTRLRFGIVSLLLGAVLIPTLIYTAASPSKDRSYDSGYSAGETAGYDRARSEAEAEIAQIQADTEAQIAEAQAAAEAEISKAYAQGFAAGEAQSQASTPSAPDNTPTAPETTQPTTEIPQPDPTDPLPDPEDPAVDLPQTGDPATTPADTPEDSPPADGNALTVYITESGSKYHTSTCSYLSKSKIPISLALAKSQGYTPCSRCHPPT